METQTNTPLYFVTAVSDTHGRVVWHEDDPVTLIQAERLVDILLTKSDLSGIAVIKDGTPWSAIA